jgi:hypothetical protein
MKRGSGLCKKIARIVGSNGQIDNSVGEWNGGRRGRGYSHWLLGPLHKRIVLVHLPPRAVVICDRKERWLNRVGRLGPGVGDELFTFGPWWWRPRRLLVRLRRRCRQVQLAERDVHEGTARATPWRQVALVLEGRGLCEGLSRGRWHVEVLAAVAGLGGLRGLGWVCGPGPGLAAHDDRQSVLALLHQFARLLEAHVVGLEAGDAGDQVAGARPRTLAGHLAHVEPAAEDDPEVVLLARPGEAEPVALGPGHLAGTRGRGARQGASLHHQQHRRARVPEDAHRRPVVRTLQRHSVRRDYPVVHSTH